MGERRQENFPQKQSRKPRYRKPNPGCTEATVSGWEKKFCTSVCSIPWKKLLETKKLMYFYENIIQWNDKAGEEAFQKAKSRFWAEINDLPCNISPPDPNIYIDEIDWDTEIDPELLSDLDKKPAFPDEEEKDAGSLCDGWDSFLFTIETVPCSGWGDVENLAELVNDSLAADDSNVWDHNSLHDEVGSSESQSKAEGIDAINNEKLRTREVTSHLGQDIK